MTVPATLIRKSTGEILKRQNLPGDPNQPIPGLDPDLEWLIDYEPFESPLYDARVFILQTAYEVTATAHPDYADYNQYLITYSTGRRDVEEIQSSVINKERTELINHVDYLDKLAILSIAILFRESDGLELTPKEEQVKQRTLRAAAKIWRNHQRRTQLFNEAAQADENMDIDSGWAESDNDEPI